MNIMIAALFMTTIMTSSFVDSSTTQNKMTTDTSAPEYTTPNVYIDINVNSTDTPESTSSLTDMSYNTGSPTDNLESHPLLCTCQTHAPNVVVSWTTPYTSSVCPYCNYTYTYPAGATQVYVNYGYNHPVKQYFYQNSTLINTCSYSRVCVKVITLNPNLPYTTIISGNENVNVSVNTQNRRFAPGRYMAVAQGYHIMENQYYPSGYNGNCSMPPQINGDNQFLISGCHYVYDLSTSKQVHMSMNFNHTTHVILYSGHHILLNHTGRHIVTTIHTPHRQHQLHVIPTEPTTAHTFHMNNMSPHTSGSQDSSQDGSQDESQDSSEENSGDDNDEEEQTISNTSQDNQTRTIAIVGIIFGMIGFIAILIASAFLYHNKRVQKQTELHMKLLHNDMILQPVSTA
jgi:uncharacterized Zn-finger protein